MNLSAYCWTCLVYKNIQSYVRINGVRFTYCKECDKISPAMAGKRENENGSI